MAAADISDAERHYMHFGSLFIENKKICKGTGNNSAERRRIHFTNSIDIDEFKVIKPYPGQWCSGAGTRRNVVPVIILPRRRNATAAAFRQMCALEIKLPL